MPHIEWPAEVAGTTEEKMLVTPELAKFWLDNCNTHNQNISQSRVQLYTDLMLSGRWTYNGEPIQFDKHGVLLNGQHRLLAMVLSNTTQTFLVVKGLERATQLTMDQGTRRSPQSQLKLAGIVADSTVAAAIRTFIRWEQGKFFGDQVRGKVSTVEVVDWAAAHPELVLMLNELSASGVRRAKCAPSTALAIALRFSIIDAEASSQFFGTLISEENMTGAILALHKRLSSIRESGVKLTEKDTVGYFTMAWNAWRTGKSLSKLQKPHGASWTVANFPIPV